MIVESPGRRDAVRTSGTKLAAPLLPQDLWRQDDLLVGRLKKFIVPLSSSPGQKYILTVKSVIPRPAFMCSVTLKVNGPDHFETVKLLKGAKAEGDACIQLSFEIPPLHKHQVIEAVVELASMSVFVRARICASIAFAESEMDATTTRECTVDECPANSTDTSLDQQCEISQERDDSAIDCAPLLDVEDCEVASQPPERGIPCTDLPDEEERHPVSFDQAAQEERARSSSPRQRPSSNLFRQFPWLAGRQDGKSGEVRRQLSWRRSPAAPTSAPMLAGVSAGEASPEEEKERQPVARRSSWGEQGSPEGGGDDGEAVPTRVVDVQRKKGEGEGRWWGLGRASSLRREGKGAQREQTEGGREQSGGSGGGLGSQEEGGEGGAGPGGPAQRRRLLFRGGRGQAGRQAPGGDGKGNGAAVPEQKAGGEEGVGEGSVVEEGEGDGEAEETLWQEERRVPAKGLKGGVVISQPGRFRFAARTLAPRILPNRAMGYVVTIASSQRGQSIELSDPEFLHAEDYFILHKEDVPARVSWSIWSHAIFNTSAVSAGLHALPAGVASRLPEHLQWLRPSKDGGVVEEVEEEAAEKDLVQQLQQPLQHLHAREAVQPVLLVLCLCALSWLNDLASLPLLHIPLAVPGLPWTLPALPVSLRGLAAAAAAAWCQTHREEVVAQFAIWQRDFSNWRRVKKFNRRAKELREKMQGKGVWGKVKLMKSEFMRTQHEQQLQSPSAAAAAAAADNSISSSHHNHNHNASQPLPTGAQSPPGADGADAYSD